MISEAHVPRPVWLEAQVVRQHLDVPQPGLAQEVADDWLEPTREHEEAHLPDRAELGKVLEARCQFGAPHLQL